MEVMEPQEAAGTGAPDIQALNAHIAAKSQFVELIRAEMGRTIVGQSGMVDRLLIGLLANGHVLLEGVPGLAKTLAIKSLSDTVAGDFSRVQFTPDLLPADVVGTLVYNQQDQQFSVKKGPVFANFVLADEINRAPAKVQSALLEAMQERQVTIGGETHPLPEPFLVLATQNPVEQEGTYPLPEAQVDRFLLKVVIGYPTKDEERQIVRANLQESGLPKPQKVVSQQDIVEARKLVRSIYMDEKIERYIVDLVFATRNPEDCGWATEKPHRLWRFAAGKHRPGHGLQGPRVLEAPWICDAGRRPGRGHGRDAPPHWRDVRSRGGKHHVRPNPDRVDGPRRGPLILPSHGGV